MGQGEGPTPEERGHFKALLVDMVSHFDCDATVVSLLTVFLNCKELSLKIA